MASPQPFITGLCLLACALVSAASSFAMSVIPPTFSQLVQKAEIVARIEVTGQNSQWDVAADGHKVIHTYVQCRVIKELKGPAENTLSLRFLGGQVGTEGMQIPDMPTFVTGRHYLVFVAANGRAFCPLVGVMHGKYSLTTGADGAEHVRRNNGAPLRAVSDVSLPDDDRGGAGAAGMKSGDFEAAITEEMRHAAVR